MQNFNIDEFMNEYDERHRPERDRSGRTIENESFSNRLFMRANFSTSTLRNVEMNNTNFSSSNFSGANLRGINFSESILGMCNLSGADLTGANLTNVDLFRADFTDANLTGANLTGADINNTILTNANLTNAILYNAKSTSDIQLDNANFTGANLSHTCMIAPLSARRVNLTNVIIDEWTRLPQISEFQNPIGMSTELREHIIRTNGQPCYEEDEEDDDAFLERLRAEREARGEPQPIQNIGVAFEIHNAFKNFNMNKYNEIIEENLKSNGQNVDEEISKEDAIKKYKSIVDKRFPPDEKESAKNKLDEILGIATNTMYFINNSKNIIISNTVKFIMTQSPKFQTEYMKLFIQDCYNAYNDRGLEGSGMSCAKGIIERIVLTVCNTAQLLCTNRVLCERNPIYRKLANIIASELDINDLTQEWAETDDFKNLTDSKTLRTSFINFVTKKYQDAGVEESVYKPKIEKQANDIQYVFDQPVGDRAFGGGAKRRRRRRTNKKKKKNTKKTMKGGRKNTKRRIV
jgi:uncharacterized protein YjbI with pentapeptide repeats